LFFMISTDEAIFYKLTSMSWDHFLAQIYPLLLLTLHPDFSFLAS